MLEPFDLPGTTVHHRGKEESLRLSAVGNDSVFRLVTGLDGKEGTVSLESEMYKGCYVYSDESSKSGGNVKLSCKSEPLVDGFKKSTSFVLREGISSYDPLSFVAKGARRNFLLQPLFSLRDEEYTVYFNIQS